MECNYDGGDCCGSNINTQYCVECQCQNGNGTTVNPLTTTLSPVSTTTWNGILEGNLYQYSNDLGNLSIKYFLFLKYLKTEKRL